MMGGRLLSMAIVVLGLALGQTAVAATFTADWSVKAANVHDPGLVIDVKPGHGSFTRELAVGQSAHVSLFRIWTDETWVNRDDMKPKPIEVHFAFTSPYSFGGSVTGRTVGTSSVLGLVQAGRLTWDGPLALAFGPEDSGRATLTLYDAIFNKGLFGLHEGKRYGALVKGRLSYDVAPIPVPAALPLLAAGIGLLGLVSARRRAAV